VLTSNCACGALLPERVLAPSGDAVNLAATAYARWADGWRRACSRAGASVGAMFLRMWEALRRGAQWRRRPALLGRAAVGGSWERRWRRTDRGKHQPHANIAWGWS